MTLPGCAWCGTDPLRYAFVNRATVESDHFTQHLVGTQPADAVPKFRVAIQSNLRRCLLHAAQGIEALHADFPALATDHGH